MEEYFKDFNFFGFNSEFDMVKTIIDEFSDKKKYSDEFRNLSVKEMVEHWIDNNHFKISNKPIKNKTIA